MVEGGGGGGYGGRDWVEVVVVVVFGVCVWLLRMEVVWMTRMMA